MAKNSISIGGEVYVPSRVWPPLIGGLAKVIFVEKGRYHGMTFQVEEHPGVTYTWSEVSSLQRKLKSLFGDIRAKLPSPEEMAKAELIQTAKMAQLAKEAEDRRIAEELAERRKTEAQVFRVLNQGLLEVPIWSDSPRAKNWAAVITANPIAAGGLERIWFARGRGPSKYIVPDTLEVGDPVEFGADEYTYSGYKRPHRWYGVVVANTSSSLCIQPVATPTDAFLRSDTIRAELAINRPRIRVDSEPPGSVPSP